MPDYWPQEEVEMEFSVVPLALVAKEVGPASGVQGAESGWAPKTVELVLAVKEVELALVVMKAEPASAEISAVSA